MATTSLRPLDVEYDLVGVIDGLPHAERYAYRVSETLIDYLASQGVDQQLAHCQTAKGVRKALTHFRSRAERGDKIALHFVCHGNREGIGLKSTSEFLEWDEFRGELGKMNSAMSGTLVVNMTSCFGINGIKIVDSSATDLPFYGLVGPKVKISFCEAILFNQAFYTGQLNGEDIRTLVTKITTVTGDQGLYAITAEGYRSAKARTRGGSPIGGTLSF